MKKNITAIVLCCLLLILEALPLGAALHIATADGVHAVQFCSYFDLMPLVTEILRLLLWRFYLLRYF